MTKRCVGVVVTLAIWISTGSAQSKPPAVATTPGQTALSADPIIGTWELNLAKSTFAAGRAPRNEIRTYVVDGNDIKASAKGVDAAGKPIATSWTINYDGKDRPASGVTDLDSISFKRIDARHYEFVQKKAGKVVSSGTRIFSADGKVMTLTLTSANAQGKTTEEIAVYDKR